MGLKPGSFQWYEVDYAETYGKLQFAHYLGYLALQGETQLFSTFHYYMAMEARASAWCNAIGILQHLEEDGEPYQTRMEADLKLAQDNDANYYAELTKEAIEIGQYV